MRGNIKKYNRNVDIFASMCVLQLSIIQLSICKLLHKYPGTYPLLLLSQQHKTCTQHTQWWTQKTPYGTCVLLSLPQHLLAGLSTHILTFPQLACWTEYSHSYIPTTLACWTAYSHSYIPTTLACWTEYSHSYIPTTLVFWTEYSHSYIPTTCLLD